MAAKIQARIDSLEQRLRALKVQKQRADARARLTAGRRERREDLRRKILVGAVVLAQVDQRVLQEEVLRGWLEAALERPDDRALFDLPVRAGHP